MSDFVAMSLSQIIVLSFTISKFGKVARIYDAIVVDRGHGR